MATVLPAGPKTVGERCLLGWMPRADATKHLIEEAVDPQFDAQSAAEAWEEYHRRVQEMPQRDATAPARLPLTEDEQAARTAFMRSNQAASNILDVIKIDPNCCIALQLTIISDRARSYAEAATNPQEKIRYCLGANQQPSINLTINPTPTALCIPLPHGEFRFGLLPDGRLEFQQLARHISVSEFDNRMLLVAGYHRSFALSALHTAEAIERSLVVALTTDGAPLVSPDSPNQAVREMARSLRPPLFGDFFDDRLAMSLRVRKRRAELWIQGQIKWFDDPS